MSIPKITFGIIVLNGEPFTKYCLRSIYPFAHEIIVVEGAHADASSVATEDGHSIDNTLQSLLEFKETEDPDNKVQIVTKDGFWSVFDETGKRRTPQSRAYAERATGDYLWQVDIDEFYRKEDLKRVIEMLRSDPSITAVSFDTVTFWGSPKCKVDGWPFIRGAKTTHRIFKWGKGYRYKTHEPSTVLDETGNDLRSLHWIKGSDLAKKGIFMYHYSLLLPWQVKQKVKLYQQERPDKCGEIIQWAEKNYFILENPYRVHNIYKYPSWLEPYNGPVPEQITLMWEDIEKGELAHEVRDMADVNELLESRKYKFGVFFLKCLEPLDRCWRKILIPKINGLINRFHKAFGAR